jgi:hypothetical protein
MADLLRAFWEPVWTKPNPPSSTINEYLASYPKRITSIPLRPTLELVLETIARSKDSSTGPDGIPYLVYRLLSDILAPLILHLVLHIASGKSANKACNHSLLFFFPKDTGYPTGPRPTPWSQS